MAEALGIWASLHLLNKGRPAGRWIACVTVSGVSLSGAAGVTLRILNWSSNDTVNANLVGHGALALYALAGATFLLLPRAGRLFTPEYRSAAGEPETPDLRAATRLARAKSPFSWVPLLLIVSGFIVQLIQGKES